ncbi:phospholipid-transporting ATPase 1-like [Dorcoceras hygrometricum]|uniref:Phospholipid-transporting ATPase 1-like n=1 Tax=Dorcoceras hygrometricum TaxID=472368 RepID=A0A2Z7BWZ2_9LAMI|nr:phospholipid-transporting ATPase 1-like [Dorcoceras hygrometricum]
MAASFFVNAMQVDFEPVLAMEHTGMDKMFMSLEDTRLKGILEASGSVYEVVVVEFFANAKFTAGTIVSFIGNKKLVRPVPPTAQELSWYQLRLLHCKLPSVQLGTHAQICSRTQQLTLTTSHIPTDHGLNRSCYSADHVRVSAPVHLTACATNTLAIHSSVCHQLASKLVSLNDIAQHSSSDCGRNADEVSGTDAPFRAPNKKKEMKMENRLLHDIFAKELCSVSDFGGDGEHAYQAVTRFCGASECSAAKSGKIRPWRVDEVATAKEANMKTNPVLETQADDESTASGPEATMETTPEVEKQADDGFVTDDQEEGVECGNQTDMEPIINEGTVVVRSGPEQPAQQSFTFAAAKGKWMLDAFPRPNPVEEHCQLVIKTAWEDVSSKMADYDKWVHFGTAVRLNTVSSFESLTKIEEQFLFWAETERVSELFERRSLVLYKLYEMEVQKRVKEHRANFKPAESSVNYDYMCIRFLSRELKEIVKQQRAPNSCWSTSSGSGSLNRRRCCQCGSSTDDMV